MNPWRPYPLLRLLFPYLAGLIIGINRLIWLPVYPVFYGIVFFFFLGLVLVPIRVSLYGFRWCAGIIVFLSFLFLGMGYGDQAILSKVKPAKVPGKGWYIVEIIDPPIMNNLSEMVKVEARCIQLNGQWEKMNGRFILHIKIDTTKETMFYGDHLLFNASWQEIRNTSNPLMFNYATYMAGKGFYHQAWIEGKDWRKLKIPASGLLRPAAFSLRNRMLDVLRNNHLKGREFAVAAALLLGYKSELDTDLKKAYSASGAMHILSVSGMHVGVVFLCIEFLLGFMNRKKGLRILKTVLVLLLIWFYAFLTGLSPSVMRASTMLSFLVTGKAMSRSPEIFNILAASLFFLLAMEPLVITDIGFQLSYLAVAGICLFYKPVYNWFITTNRTWNKIWAILVVSLVAQLSTFPVCLYFFHQFPNYFLLTNLFVVPLSSIVIYLGMLALIFGMVPWLSVFLTKLLAYLIWLLNFLIQGVETLPFSTSSGIYLSLPEILLMYFIIGCAYIFLMKMNRKAIFPLLIGIILLEGLMLSGKVNGLKKSRITVYNVKKMAAYEFSSRGKAVLFYDFNELYGFQSRLENAIESIRPSWEASGIQYHCLHWLGSLRQKSKMNWSAGRYWQRDAYFQFESKRIAVLKEKIPKSIKSKIQLDYLIISGNPKIKMEEVMRVYQVKELVFDATNSFSRINRWLEEAGELGVTCHVVTRDGAFVREF